MTDTITDPQEQALMQAVVEASERLAFEWVASNGRSQFTTLEIEAGKNLRDAVQALQAHRKSSSPEPARCEPPEGAERGSFHWLCGDDAPEHPTMAEWAPGAWWFTGDDKKRYPAEVHQLGWRYHSVASPCLPDTRPSDEEVEQTEPTDEAIEKLWDWFFGSGEKMPMQPNRARFVRLCLSRFGQGKSEVAEQVHPTETAPSSHASALDDVSPIQATSYCASDQYDVTASDPTQPDTPVQQEITDGEIMALAEPYVFLAPHLIRFARAILAKHSTQPTPAQWETIRHLAITEAPEVFAQEARDVLRGMTR